MCAWEITRVLMIIVYVVGATAPSGDGVGDDKSCLLTVKGTEYVGTWNKTKNGHDCQVWSSQEPHDHRNWFGSDVEQTAAINYCRNPDNIVTTWCYTTEKTPRWEYCDIPLCTPISDPPAGYQGWSDVHITGLNLETYNDVSLKECAAKCNAYMATINPITCASFDYDVKNYRCYLSDRTVDNILASLSLVYAKGIDHYQRAGLDICDIPSLERQPLVGSPGGRDACLVQGGCYADWKCYLSKSAIKTDLPCDASCQAVINEVINNFPSENYNQEFLASSVQEAKQNCPDITDDFWTWLTGQPEMLASMFAVKWPMETKLLENLFYLVDAFGKQAAEDHRNLFVGVSYSLIDNGVVNRPNIDFVKESGYNFPEDAAKSEGLSQAEIDEMKEEEDAAAKAALKITAEQTQKEFDDIQEKLSTCKDDPSLNWVTLYLAGDRQKLACKQLVQKSVGSVTECQKLACQRRSNGFNYVSGNCDVQFCSGGNLVLHDDDSGTYEAWVFMRESPGCLMDTNKEVAGKQEKSQFKAITSVNSVEACNEECAKRYACTSATHDNKDSMCQLNRFLYEVTVPEGEDHTRYTTVLKTCTFTPEVPETGCLKTVKGEDYKGTMSITEGGRVCQHWIDQVPHDHRDWMGGPENEQAAVNYCRNADNTNRPWCYTVDPDKRWEYCDIPGCTKADEPDVFTLLHASSDNMESNCYKSVHNEKTKDVESCLSMATERRVTIAQFHPVSKICDLRVCYTSDLGITSVAAGDGLEIYRDVALVFDEGEPESHWDDRRHLSYLHDYIWDIFSLQWAKTCQVPSANDLPFPPRDARMNGFDVIQHYLSKDYSFTTFPTLTAPWALVSLLWPESSKRECDYVWSILYNHVEPVYYSSYTFNYQKKEVKCRESKWYPHLTIPRIIVDGGVCGRQSYLSEQTRRCFGQPALGLRQPGHRALFYMDYKPDDSSKGPFYGPYRVEIDQGLTSTVFYNNVYDYNGRGMFYPTGTHVWEQYTTLEFYKGLAASVNKGEATFTKAMIAMAVHNRAPVQQKEAALGIVFDALTENPYMVNVWMYIMNFLTGSTPDWHATETIALYDRYAMECPTSSAYKERKSGVWSVAKTHLNEFPAVYSDIVLRFYAPAPCCTDTVITNEILTELQQQVDNMETYFKNKYDRHEAMRIVQKNMALCKAYAGGSWTDILDYLKPVLVTESLSTGKIWGYGRIKAVVEFIKSYLMDRKADTDASKMEIVQYLDGIISTSMTLLIVNEATWSLRPELITLADYMKELYTDLNDSVKKADLEAFLADLVDRTHGGDISFWQNLANKGQIEGAFEGILDGLKTWNAATNSFESTDTRQQIDREKRARQEESKEYLKEELEAIEKELQELFI